MEVANMKRIIFLIFILLFFPLNAEENVYLPPEDPLVLEKLEKWQDIKFGLLMHWGAYS